LYFDFNDFATLKTLHRTSYTSELKAQAKIIPMGEEKVTSFVEILCTCWVRCGKKELSGRFSVHWKA